MTVPLPPGILAALDGAGIPTPVRVTPLGEPGDAVTDQALHLPDGATVWLRCAEDPAWVQREAAALGALEGFDAVPVTPRYLALDALGAPGCALLAPLPGVRASTLLRDHPEHARDVAALLGAVADRLAGIPQQRFGSLADGGLFLPRARHWAEEWLSRADAHAATARARGTDLGPLSERLLAAVHARAPALRALRHPALVHGDLSPHALLVGTGPGLTLTGLDRWNHALAGDPLVDRARLLLLPTESIGAVCAGWRLAHDEEHARLEAYLFGLLLQRLAGAARGADGGRRRASELEKVRLAAEQTLEPHFLAGKLAGRGASRPSPTRRETVLRGAIDRLQVAPGLLPRTADAWMGIVAGALHGEREVVRAAGRRLLALPRTEVPRHAVALDRGAWRDDLVHATVAAAPRAPGRQRGLVAAALGLQGFDALGGAVSDDARAALRAGVWALLARDALERAAAPPRAPTLLAHGLLGLSALVGLDPACPPLRDVLRAQVADAWFGLEFALPPPGRDLPTGLRLLALGEGLGPALALAIPRLATTGDLPDDPTRVIDALSSE